MTDTDVDAAIAELRDACRRAYEAREARDSARDDRKAVAKRTWKVLHPLGPKLIADRMGADEKARAVIRAMTADLTPRPPRGPRGDLPVTKRQDEAIGELRDAMTALDRAEATLKDTLDQRWYAIRRAWPTVAHLGPRGVARAVGGGYVGESTISVTTTDLRRAQGERDDTAQVRPE